MVRRRCLYCKKDLGEALPREVWARYPDGTITHGQCEPACPELRAVLADADTASSEELEAAAVILRDPTPRNGFEGHHA